MKVFGACCKSTVLSETLLTIVSALGKHWENVCSVVLRPDQTDRSIPECFVEESTFPVQSCRRPPYSRVDLSSSDCQLSGNVFPVFLPLRAGLRTDWASTEVMLGEKNGIDNNKIWTSPDFARLLFVLSAVFCANWRVKPSGLTFRGTDDLLIRGNDPAAAGQTVTGMSDEWNAVKSSHSSSSDSQAVIHCLSLASRCETHWGQCVRKLTRVKCIWSSLLWD